MSDGQFSAKPIRTGGRREPLRGGEFSTEAMPASDTARAFLQSPAVLREIDALLNEPLPEVGQRNCKALHKNTPTAAQELGPPLASATLVQEYLIGLIFLRVCGWIFLFFGVMLLVMAVVFLVVRIVNGPEPRDRDGFAPFFGIAGFGLVITAIGAWFGIFRGRVITEMCWFCPRGMIWMTEGVFDWYTWDQVPDLYCNLQLERPAIGISFGANVSWISFSNTPASRRMVEYIEKLASAACIVGTMKKFAGGKTFPFGTWRISRIAIRDADADVYWDDVISAACEHRELRVKQSDGSLIVPLDEVPFPSLFVALALANFGYQRERTA